jgi:hypothetical protein
MNAVAITFQNESNRRVIRFADGSIRVTATTDSGTTFPEHDTDGLGIIINLPVPQGGWKRFEMHHSAA